MSLAQTREQLKLNDQPAWVHALALGACALTTVGFILLFFAYRNVNFWEGWAESNGLRSPSYAETIFIESIFRTRSNTWSNLAFVFVGYYAIALGLHDLRRKSDAQRGYLVNTAPMSILFGVACAYLGIGSGIFHASLTRWGQQLDVASMYAPLCVLIAISLGALWNHFRPSAPNAWPLLAVVAGIASALLYVYKWQMSSSTVLPTLILLTGALRFPAHILRGGYQLRWIALAFLALFLAVVCRQTDVAGKFSGPDAWLQGHALWHVLNAVSLACIYLYDRSEDHAA